MSVSAAERHQLEYITMENPPSVNKLEKNRDNLAKITFKYLLIIALFYYN